MNIREFSSATSLVDKKTLDRAIYLLYWLMQYQNQRAATVKDLAELMLSLGLQKPHGAKLRQALADSRSTFQPKRDFFSLNPKTVGIIDLEFGKEEQRFPVWQPAAQQKAPSVISSPEKDKVFVVYGHNETAKLKLENFLHKIGVDPVVIDDRPKRGNTIIEQIEHHSNVKYAVVLLTDDDLGAAKDDVKSLKSLKPRARQNGILELGFFIGKLGRENVATLITPTIERPSDFHDVIYIPLTSDWKEDLRKELRAANVNINGS